MTPATAHPAAIHHAGAAAASGDRRIPRTGRARRAARVGALVAALVVIRVDVAPAQDAAPAAAVRIRATARTVRFMSDALGAVQTFAILLPEDYEQTTRRYPVVYLLHGGGQNHTAFPARSGFTAAAARRGAIFVMPDGGRSFFVNSASLPGARYEDYMIRDLVGYVDATYRTVPAREARAIAGISMGGFGAALLGLKHPDVFGTVGALSAPLGVAGSTPSAAARPDTARTFGPPDSDERRSRDPMAVAAAIDAARAPFVYIACGLGDDLLPMSRAFDRLLSDRGIPHVMHEVPGAHSWEVWDPQLAAFLDHLPARPGWGAR